MCGIIAASSKEKLDFSAIRLGMLQAESRGGHSCGISTKGEKPTTIRQVAGAKTFLNDSKDEVKIPRNNNSFIGHTRYATKGKKTTENAHPFIFGDVIGVHNGTIENFQELKNRNIESYRKLVHKWKGENWKESLDVKKRKDLNIESDSKLLYFLIWRDGIRRTLPKLKGTLALVYYKREEEGDFMYLYRHDKPLCYGKKDGEIWVASLKKYLDVLGCKNIKSLTEHALCKIKDGKIIYCKELPDKDKPAYYYFKKDVDFDPELEPEKKSKTRTSRSRYSERDNYWNDWEKNENHNVEVTNEDWEFCAPFSAKGDLNEDEKLCLYWFSNDDGSTVYIEQQFRDKVDKYNLKDKDDIEQLKRDYKTLYEHIIDDFAQIEITQEYRNNKETYQS